MPCQNCARHSAKGVLKAAETLSSTLERANCCRKDRPWGWGALWTKPKGRGSLTCKKDAVQETPEILQDVKHSKKIRFLGKIAAFQCPRQQLNLIYIYRYYMIIWHADVYTYSVYTYMCVWGERETEREREVERRRDFRLYKSNPKDVLMADSVGQWSTTPNCTDSRGMRFVITMVDLAIQP